MGTTLTLPFTAASGVPLAPAFQIVRAVAGVGVDGVSKVLQLFQVSPNPTSFRSACEELAQPRLIQVGAGGIQQALESIGVQGLSPNGTGVSGSGNNGVTGAGTSGAGVAGISVSGSGIFGSSTSGNAGEFHGNVVVTGDLSVQGKTKTTRQVRKLGMPDAHRH